LPPFDQLFDPVQALLYSGFYSGGRYTLLVNGPTGRFLWPGVYSVLELPTGLTETDFPMVELGVSFGPQLGSAFFPGTSGTQSRVQIVPEPSANFVSSITLLYLGFLIQFARSPSPRNANKHNARKTCPPK
jgi:hypothetical protein